MSVTLQLNNTANTASNHLWLFPRNAHEMAPASLNSNIIIITSPCLHMPKEGCPCKHSLFYWIIPHGNILPKRPHIQVIEAML